MTANSHDALVAGVIFGAVLILVAQGLMWLVRSEWSERKARKAEDIMGLPHADSDYRDHLVAQEQAAAPFARHLDAGSADYEAHVADAVRMLEDAQDRRLASVAPVVPIQRDRRGS